MYLSFFRIPLILFGCIGVHPGEQYTAKQIFLYFIIFISQWSIVYLAILHLSYKESITIPDLTTAFETLFLIFHASMKLSMLFIKKSKFEDLLERTNHFWKIEDLENEIEKEEYKKYLTFIKTLSTMYNALSVTTSAAFTLKPFLVKGGYLTFTTYKPDWIPFYVMALYQDMVFIFGVYAPAVGIDLFALVLLLLVKMQFKMLNREMGRVFQGTPKSKEYLEDNILYKRIKKTVDYHNFLLDYVNRINNLISEGMLVYVIIIVLSMCVEMYIVSTQKSVTAAVKVVLYMTNGLLQYSICYCIPAQAVTDEAERTVNYVYFNKWYEHPVSSVKVTQTMILARAQQKTLILAGGYIKINLETCLATLKTMVSYAMFIRTMGIGEN